MNDDNFRNVLSKNARRYVARKIKWSVIARKHTEVYKKGIGCVKKEKLIEKKKRNEER